MKKQFCRSMPGRAQVIGAAGAEKGCGATHFIWSAANYLSNVKGSRVVVCNLSGEPDYGQAKVILGRPDKEDTFTYGGITFLERADEAELPELTKLYDYVLLDLGCEGEKYRRLLSRCDERFLIGALNEWRCRNFITAALHLERLYGGSFAALAVFYSAAGIKHYKAAAGRAVRIIPYEPEPFCLHRDMLVFMEQVF